MRPVHGGRSVSVLASLALVFAGLGLGALPAEAAAAKGKIQVTVKAPKGVKAKVAVSKKGAKSFSVTKASSKKSVKKTKSVKTGTWSTKGTFVKKGSTYYVAKKTSTKVRKNRTAKVTVTFRKATVARSPKATAGTNKVTLKFKAANKKYPVQLRYAAGSKAPKTVKNGTRVSLAKGARSKTVTGLTPGTTYSFSLFTKVNGVWVGPVSPAKVTTKYPTLTRVSVSSNGVQADGNSGRAVVSGNGRYVAFESVATNLVSPATDGTTQVFVHDRRTSRTTLVSVSSGGMRANGPSERPSISADGRYVAFESRASNLVDGDTNGNFDIFVHDRKTRETTRISVTNSGEQSGLPSFAASISADGRYVAFNSASEDFFPADHNYESHVYVHDRKTRKVVRASESSSGAVANDLSREPSLSAD